MKNIFEISTHPAARVVSVGALRSMEASVELDKFTDQTLAEVQFIASHVTDEGVEVLVLIVVETDTHRVTGQAEVPFEWFQRQIRMRSILNSPNDISTVLNNTDEKQPHVSARPKTQEVHLANLGKFLAKNWSGRRRQDDLLAPATSAWLGLVGEKRMATLLTVSDEIRLLLTSQLWSKSERRQIAAFCSAITSRLKST